MANAYKCDACGKLYEYFDGLPVFGRSNGFNSIMLKHRGFCEEPKENVFLKSLDLCPSCCTKLNDFLFGSSGKEL